MIDIQSVVYIVLYLLGAAAIFGLLFFLIGYIEKNVGGPTVVYNVIRIILVVLIVLVAIGLILSLMGHKVFVWGQP